VFASASVLPHSLQPPGPGGYIFVLLAPLLSGPIAYGLLLMWFRRHDRETAAVQEAPDPAPAWLAADSVLDAQYLAAIGQQVQELSSYRTEAFQVAGFAGAVAAATTAVDIGNLTWELCVAVVLFAVIVLIELIGVAAGQAAPRAPDPYAIEASSADGLVAATQNPKLTGPDLRWTVRKQSREAYESNRKSIKRRRDALLRMRILLGIAVLTFGIAAITSQSSSKSASAPMGNQGAAGHLAHHAIHSR
jgi:hypothetical protein